MYRLPDQESPIEDEYGLDLYWKSSLARKQLLLLDGVLTYAGYLCRGVVFGDGRLT